MFGAWPAGELTGGALILETTSTALRTRRKAAGAAAWSALWAAVEDGLAALNPLACRVGIGRRGSRRWRWRRSLVDRAGPGLGHDYFAHLDYRSRGRRDRRLRNRRGRLFLRWRADHATAVACGRDGRWDGGRFRSSGWRELGRPGKNSGLRRCRRFRNFRSCRRGCCDCFWLSRNRLCLRGCNRSCGWCGCTCRGCRRCRRLDHHSDGRRRDSHGRSGRKGRRRRTGRRPCNNGARGRTGADSGRRGRSGGWCLNNRRSLTGLRHNPARLGLDGCRRRGDYAVRRRRGGTRCAGRSGGSLRGRTGGRRTHDHRRSRRGSRRTLGKLGLALCFLLLGQNRLEHVAGLGDIGEVNLGLIVLLGTRA